MLRQSRPGAGDHRARLRTGAHTILFDGGPVDYAVERNGVRLGIDFGAIGAVMLSHGHWDHAGGIPRALGNDRPGEWRAGRAAVFASRHVPAARRAAAGRRRAADATRSHTPADWALLGAEPVVTDTAQTCLDDRFFVSGEIPRITAYEKGLAGQVCRPYDGAPWEPDPLLMDERFLAVHVRDKGMVVFSACSHAGIVNVMHHVHVDVPGREVCMR